MNDYQETIADFIEVRRARANQIESAAGGKPDQFQHKLIADLRDEADRLEAAWKREKATTEKSSIVGDYAELREALDGLTIASENFIRVHNSQSYRDTMKALDKARAALAEQKHEAKWELGAEYEFACCSHCGYMQYAGWDSSQEAAENVGEFHKECKFCPNCGFEMKGESDGSK